MSSVATDFAQRIAQAHEAATGSLRDAVAHAVRAGELLIQAKDAMPHGSFGAFCAGLPFAETTARGYMRLARQDPANRQRVADLPLRAALLQVSEPRPAEAETSTNVPDIVIPLGSVGTVVWRGPANEVRRFEVHPVLWPDGETVGLHYAFAEAPETCNGFVECSRRAGNAAVLGVRELAASYEVPLESMRVTAGPPTLWESPPPPEWPRRYRASRQS